MNLEEGPVRLHYNRICDLNDWTLMQLMLQAFIKIVWFQMSLIFML